MRLVILTHDIGKTVATAEGEKYKQKQYNATYADDFMSKLDVDERTKNLLLAVIGEGAELAFQIDIKQAGEPAEEALRELATSTLKQFYDAETVAEGQIEGFIEMCGMLQICDGGAYTTMAVTSQRDGRHQP